MNKVTIYHNSRCRKSRETLQILIDKGLEPDVIEYLKNPLDVNELKKISEKLGLRPKDFIRQNEQEFKAAGLRDKLEDDEELFRRMEATPKLMERPIVVKGNKAVLGRPPKNVHDLL
jgi:arsenate reductase